ncbi:SARP family transcriptional regulator [Deinococcus psychrotolerans]|uniref:SARP family transcriptional regulator n=1 Tax=Deinococcus psychrotolerans TaxID=2489213 RepID=A0A3G8YHF2_9DEIO|nr:SARP family transcriptional regulator [Deinococcus psychrotolerans]
MEQLQSQLELGQYQAVIAALESAADTPVTWRLLGLAYLRSGEAQLAELPLLQAHLQGDSEASVEYGNYLRFAGRFEEACRHFASVHPDLHGELSLRCLRWWGVTELQHGDIEAGIKRLERAWYGYIAFGDAELTARVTSSLAQTYLRTGNHSRAKHLFQEALRQLPEQPLPQPRLTALHGLLELQIQQGDYLGAEATLELVGRALRYTDAVREHTLALIARCELQRLTGKFERYTEHLEEVALRAGALEDYELSVWATAKLAERYSALERFGEGLRTLAEFGTPQEQWPAELWAAFGMLLRRRHQPKEAEDALHRAAQQLRQQGRAPELIRVLMHAGAAALSDQRSELAVTHFREALFEMLRLKLHTAFQPDFDELQELVHYALLEPETAPLLEPVLDNLAHLIGSPRLPEDSLMSLQISTLGRVSVFKDHTEVPLSLKGSALLLAYLHLHPGKTRAEIQLALYPDKDPKTGSGYIRSAIAELREQLGREVVVFTGLKNAPVYRLGRLVHCELDVSAFRQAADRGEAARMLALYRGEFMPSIQDSAWVQEIREELWLTFTLELRVQLTRFEASGDWRRVILLANQYLKFDPYDQGVLQLRVNAAQVVGTPHELARYTVQLKRIYN